MSAGNNFELVKGKAGGESAADRDQQVPCDISVGRVASVQDLARGNEREQRYQIRRVPPGSVEEEVRVLVSNSGQPREVRDSGVGEDDRAVAVTARVRASAARGASSDFTQNWVPGVFGGVSNDIEAAAPHTSATQPRNLAQSGAAVGLDGTAAADHGTAPTAGDGQSSSALWTSGR